MLDNGKWHCTKENKHNIITFFSLCQTQSIAPRSRLSIRLFLLAGTKEENLRT